MRKVKEQTGSMAVYVSIVLLCMLFILMALFMRSNAVMVSQLESTIRLKQSYEADNQKASEIYEGVTQELASKYVFVQDFDTLPSYSVDRTTATVANGVITLTATGNDPQIHMKNVTSFSPLTYRYIEVRYRTNSSSGMEFFMIEDPVDQTYSVTAPMTGDGQWHVLTIDLWSNENVKNRSSITGWRWDWRFDADGTVDIDYIKIRK